VGAVLVLVAVLSDEPRFTPAPWTPCPAGSLDAKAAALLLPVLTERVAAHQDVEAKGVSLDRSRHFQAFQKLLYGLLKDHSAYADEAIAALLHVYVGEAASGDMECEIIHRGQRMLPYLKRFQSCMPCVKGISIPHGLMDDLPNLYPELIDSVTKRETCEPD
jgi:hypothetical protein